MSDRTALQPQAVWISVFFFPFSFFFFNLFPLSHRTKTRSPLQQLLEKAGHAGVSSWGDLLALWQSKKMASKLQCAFRCLECPEVLIICSEFVKDNSDSAFSLYPPAMSDYLLFYFCAQRPCCPVTAFYSVFFLGGETAPTGKYQFGVRAVEIYSLVDCRIATTQRAVIWIWLARTLFYHRMNTLWPRLHPALACISISRSMRMNRCTTFCSQKRRVQLLLNLQEGPNN